MADVEEVKLHAPDEAALMLPSLHDEDDHLNPAFVEAVTQAVEANDIDRLKLLTYDFHESDFGEILEALDAEHRPRLIELLGPDFDFTALTEVDDSVREAILDDLGSAAVAEGVRDLDTDDAVYILEDLDETEQAEILDKLPAPERIVLARALEYPEDSAGRLMQSEFIAVPPFWSVGQTIDFMRETEDLPDTFYEIFVTDPAGKLIGAVPLDKLLRSKRPTIVSDIMTGEPDTVEANEPQDDVAHLFQRYNLVSAAVTDEDGRLVGVITIDDVVDVIEEEADADIKALGGVMADEEISDSVRAILKSRFTWLFINLCMALIAANVIGSFSHSLEKMVALAVLMPMVASMGGNAATQTMTVAVRALATRELGRNNTWRIVRRELLVGLCNGLAFATLMGSIAIIWFGVPSLGPVLGAAVIATMLVAAFGGIIIPLTLEYFKVDPAVSSGPLVTTVTDIVGFFAFLGIATLWFGL
jgi:Mg2+ transporter (mgtE)